MSKRNEEQPDLFGDAQALRRQAAEQARDRGMEQAIGHADAMSPDWGENAHQHARAALRELPSRSFVTCEQLREVAEKRGLPMPPDRRAWGAVMTRLAKVGLISKHGYTEAKDPRVHCNPVTLWRKTT